VGNSVRDENRCNRHVNPLLEFFQKRAGTFALLRQRFDLRVVHGKQHGLEYGTQKRNNERHGYRGNENLHNSLQTAKPVRGSTLLVARRASTSGP